MSDEQVRAALGALRPTPSGDLLHDISRVHCFDRDVLREVLIRCACPIVCIGHRDPGGEDWHEWCERKADAALAVIESVSPPKETR